jgi:malate dehydrogenase (oxaloacetate-decarboxylating)(NADP+)
LHPRPTGREVEVRPIKRRLARDMRLAALPGAGFPCAAIQADPEAVFRFTAKGNLVGIITNGSAVPGLGDVGPTVAKPMLEGAAVLFKRLADLDGFDLELDTRDPDRFVEPSAYSGPRSGVARRTFARPRARHLPALARRCASP